MPVYNGEQYLRDSIGSVLAQSFFDFEILCVDDSSQDNSFPILQEIAHQDTRVKVFRKPNGGNVPNSWNFVLPLLSGDFVMYMSQDDRMSPDNMELCHNRYLETKAEAIVPYLKTYSSEIDCRRIQSKEKETISGEKAFIDSLAWNIHGFCLWKKTLFEGYHFDDSIFNDDEYMTRYNFIRCQNVAFSNGIFFYKDNNNNSINKIPKVYHCEKLLCDRKILSLMEDYNITPIAINKWRLHMLDNLYGIYVFINQNKKSWSTDDYAYGRSVLRKSIDSFVIPLLGIISNPKRIVKCILLKYA